MDFHSYIAVKPQSAEAYFNKGLTEAALGNDSVAIDDFTRTIELKPNYETAYFERGKIYLKQDDKAEACKDFKEAYNRGCLPAHHYVKTICSSD